MALQRRTGGLHRDDQEERPLSGGFVGGAVRVGDMVHKAPPPDPGFVHRLLGHFERHRWSGAPRWRGTDDRGRDVLSYVDGDVPYQQGHLPALVRSEAGLAAVARLVRQFHDLTAGTELAGDHEVVCHNDLSPKNTVYRDGGAGLLPVAFIDWDLAAPGRRVHDLAHVCWQYVGLGPAVRDPGEAGHLLAVIVTAYDEGDGPANGRADRDRADRDRADRGRVDRGEVVDAILWWQDRCWRGILAAADAGQPAMISLRDLGVADDVRAAHEWTAHHQAVLRHALRSGNEMIT